MSYFEEQEDAWMENGCKGTIEEYDPFDPDSWPKRHAATAEIRWKGPAQNPPKRTKSQKRNATRRRAEKRKKEQANRAEASL